MHQGQRTLSAEHRSAPAFGPVALELAQSDLGTFLKAASINNNPSEPPQNGLAERIINLLSSTPEPLTIDALRSRLQVRNQRVVEALRILASEGKIVRNTRGFSLPQVNKTPVQISW